MAKVTSVTSAEDETINSNKRRGSIVQLEYKLHQLHSSFEFLAAKDYSTYKWYMKIPIVDVVVDTFFTSQTTPEAMTETMNVIALVSALLASVVSNIPMSFSWEEVSHIHDSIWAGNTSKWATYYRLSESESAEDVANRVSEYYAGGMAYVSASMYLLFGSTLLSCIVLVMLKSTSFRSPASTRNQISAGMFNAWYSVIRIPYAGAFFFCVFGCFFMFTAMSWLVCQKFPDYSCQGKSGFDCFYRFPVHTNSVWGRFFFDGVIFICLTVAITWALASIALRRKRKVYAGILSTMKSFFNEGRPKSLKKFIEVDVLEGNAGTIGISEEDINNAAMIFLEHGMYSRDIIRAEIDFIDWGDYEGFPVRVKQRLLKHFQVRNTALEF